MQEPSNNVISLLRYSRRAVIIIIDIFLCIFCTWLASSLVSEKLILFKDINILLLLVSVLSSISIFWFMGFYQTINRLTDFSIIFLLFKSILVYGILYFLLILFLNLPNISKSIGIIQPMLLFFTITSSRLFIKNILNKGLDSRNLSKKKNVLIYGAGGAGRQLVMALENSPEYKVVGLLDDDIRLHRQFLFGHKINSLSKLEKIIQTKDVNFIFLAMPSIDRSKRNQILNNLNNFQITVKTLPSLSEIDRKSVV